MKRISSYAIVENAKQGIERRIEEERNSGKFWQHNVQFTGDAEFVKSFDSVDELFYELDIKGYKQDQKRKDFEILLANLLNNPRKAISISLNRNDYVQNRYSKVSAFTIDLVEHLQRMNMIEVKKGFKAEISRQTRICATQKLLEYCPVSRAGVVLRPKELVILRDANNRLKEYKDTRETHRVRAILRQANEVNGRANIRHSGHKIDVVLRAIFKEKFTWYGRIHTQGSRHPQGLSGPNRERLTINGEHVIELDFKALHPNLLYAQAGIQYVGDPYQIDDDYNEQELRIFRKYILLSMLNAKDFTQAEKAANHWLNITGNETETRKLHALGITKARPFMERFVKAHKPIAHFFFNGKDTGMRIMNKDSKIALDIVSHFVEQEKPIIPVHDSFIVQEKYRRELRHVMHAAYRKHTGGFEIKVT